MNEFILVNYLFVLKEHLFYNTLSNYLFSNILFSLINRLLLLTTAYSQ